jgi:uncharacterized integral membrane protein
MTKTKKGKIVFWIIFIVLVLILYLQNQDFFMQKEELSLNLFFFALKPPFPLPNIVIVAGFFFIGLIIAFFFGLIEKYRTKKVIQDLNRKLDEQNKMLTTQKNEVDRLRKVLQEGGEINSQDQDTVANGSVSQSAGYENKR